MATRPRILFVANGILGWNTYSRQLERVLGQRDDVVAQVLWRRPHRLRTLFLKRHNLSPMQRMYRRTDMLTAYSRGLGADIRRAVADFRPDVVHFASHWPGAALAAGAPPFTLSLDATRPNMQAFLDRGVWSPDDIAREGALFRRAARVFPMSHWAGASVGADHGVDADRISVMPPSLDLSLFAPHRGGGDGPVNILFIGNDFARKGADRLVDWVRGPLAGRCHLHIVSGDKRAMVTGTGIASHGTVPHQVLLRELLPQMDIFCLPTRLDMSPHVLVEAAAAGLPSVASDLGGIPDLVRHGKTGVLVPPDDDAGFVAALERLAAAPDLRRKMGIAARGKAEAEFDAGGNFNRLVDDLKSIARGPVS